MAQEKQIKTPTRAGPDSTRSFIKYMMRNTKSKLTNQEEKETLNDWLDRVAEERERGIWADLQANGAAAEWGERSWV